MSRHEIPAPQGAEQKNQRRRLVPLLLLLLALVGVTSCMVGYLLGQRAAGGAGGQIIDTILLDPDQSGNDDAKPLSLSGYIRYTDGTPYANGTVRLHSEPRETETDGEGAFFFYNVDPGEHTISVVNADNTVLAHSAVTVSENAVSGELTLSGDSEHGYTLALPLDIALIEIEVEIDEKGGRLLLHTDGITSVTYGKTVITSGGTASSEKAAVLTPHGAATLPDGSVVIPNAGVILPDGQFVARDGSLTSPDGATITPNGVVITDHGERLDGGNAALTLTDGTVIDLNSGSVALPNGTSIHPDNTVVLPDGTVIDNENGTVALPDGTKVTDGKVTTPDGTVVTVPNGEGLVVGEDVRPVGGTPGTSATPDNPVIPSDSSAPAQPGTTGGPATPSKPTNPTEPVKPTDPAKPADPVKPTEPAKPTDPEKPTNPVGPDNSGGSGDGGGGGGGGTPPVNPPEDPDTPLGEMITVKDSSYPDGWIQESAIDLFGGSGKKLCPGVSGSYAFSIQNNQDYAIRFALRISETHEAGAIPFEYRLQDAGGEPLSGGTWLTAGQLGDVLVSLAAGEGVGYRLQWRWPYESGNDALDTAIGTNGNPEHKIKVTIYAEQME